MNETARAMQLPKRLTPAEAERDTEQTRAELGRIADALQERLARRHLVEKGFDMLKKYSGSYDGLNRGLDAIRANPIPIALIGIGAAWLIAERVVEADRIEATRRRVTELTSAAGARASDLVADASASIGLGGEDDRALGPTLNAGDVGHSEGWTHHMVGAAQDAVQAVRSSGEAMLDSAGRYAANGTGRFADQLRGAVQRHPLTAGALSLAAGVLIAALLPSSRTETELLSSTSEHLRRRIRETATRAVGAAADAAAETVRSEVDKPSQR